MEPTLEKSRKEHELLLAQVANLLGEPVRAITLDWETWEIARRKWHLLGQHGLKGSDPVLQLCQGIERLKLEIGLNHYQIPAAPIATEMLDLVQVISTSSCQRGGPYYDFWAVRSSIYCKKSSNENRERKPGSAPLSYLRN